jgi:NAD(P)H-hydrate epimerase
MITSLLAQEYSSEDASILAVYLHGLAGDIAGKRNFTGSNDSWRYN